jgi:hypothetical protein
VEPSTGWHSSRFVKEHLQDAHKDKLADLSDAHLEKNDLFVCRECDDKSFVSLTTLNNHVRSNHCETRSLNNLDLLEATLFCDLKGSCDSYWVDGLAFLNQQPLEPPPFRQTLTSKIKFRLEQSVCSTFLKCIDTANESLKTVPHHSTVNKSSFEPWSIVQLPILFEQLVLFPLPKAANNKKKPVSLNATIHNCLRRFKQGKLRELYNESRSIVSKSPREQANQPVDIQRAAQLAADLDNFKSANARVTKHAPVALINDSNIHVLRNLHPPSLLRGCIKATKSTRSGGTRRKIKFTAKQVLKTLSHLHRGKVQAFTVTPSTFTSNQHGASPYPTKQESVTPTLSPSSSVPLPMVTSHNSSSTSFAKLISSLWKKTLKIKPNYDPWASHLLFDASQPSSFFRNTQAPLQNIFCPLILQLE